MSPYNVKTFRFLVFASLFGKYKRIPPGNSVTAFFYAYPLLVVVFVTSNHSSEPFPYLHRLSSLKTYDLTGFYSKECCLPLTLANLAAIFFFVCSEYLLLALGMGIKPFGSWYSLPP